MSVGGINNKGCMHVRLMAIILPFCFSVTLLCFFYCISWMPFRCFLSEMCAFFLSKLGEFRSIRDDSGLVYIVGPSGYLYEVTAECTYIDLMLYVLPLVVCIVNFRIKWSIVYIAALLPVFLFLTTLRIVIAIFFITTEPHGG